MANIKLRVKEMKKNLQTTGEVSKTPERFVKPGVNKRVRNGGVYNQVALLNSLGNEEEDVKPSA